MTADSNLQLAGAELLEGTYAFDLRASHHALRLNRFFWRFTDPAWRSQYATDPDRLMQEAGLTDEEKDLMRRHDWIGLGSGADPSEQRGQGLMRHSLGGD